MSQQGSFGVQKFVLNSGQVALGAPESLYTALQSIVIATGGGTAIVPAGLWMVLAVTDVEVQVCTDGDTAWSIYIASGEGGVVISDGYNFRFNASAGATVQYVGLA